MGLEENLKSEKYIHNPRDYENSRKIKIKEKKWPPRNSYALVCFTS